MNAKPDGGDVIPGKPLRILRITSRLQDAPHDMRNIERNEGFMRRSGPGPQLALQSDREPGFFLGLPYGGFDNGFAKLNPAPGKRPAPDLGRIAPTDQYQPLPSLV